MKEIDDGVIKFNLSDFKPTKSIDYNVYADLEKVRLELYKRNLIGEYPKEKVGFGNLSKLIDNSEFLISGTQTGHLRNLNGSHYCIVTGFDLYNNKVSSKGPMKPSSESLTHAAIYDSNKDITCVIHIHHTIMWKNMIEDSHLSTAKDIPYGTIEMAKATQSISKKMSEGSFVMEGHQDGIVIFSKNLEDCLEETLKLYNKFS